MKNIDIETNEKNIKYNFEFKMKLKNRIEKIKNKKCLTEIFEIINPNNEKCMENTHGIFIFIHNLDDTIYKKLDLYLENLYYKNELKKSINDFHID